MKTKICKILLHFASAIAKVRLSVHLDQWLEEAQTPSV